MAAVTGAKQAGGLIHTHFLASDLVKSELPSSEHVTFGPTGAVGPAATLRAIVEVRHREPKVIVFSLWRSLTPFFALRILYPRKKFVLFLHLTRRMHFADALATRLMMAMADEIWADSLPTLNAQVRGSKPTRVISMLVHPILARPERTEAGPRFVSWCRLNKQKRVDRALELVARLKRDRPDVSYTIIGGDDGCLEPLQELANQLDLSRHVEFVGIQDRDFILKAADRATFYLQLSDYEGHAMAVAEAMQLGLIPVVTPVGAIPTYCVDGVNAVLVSDIGEAAKRVQLLLSDADIISRMSKAALETFADTPAYTESVLNAARAATSDR